MVVFLCQEEVNLSFNILRGWLSWNVFRSRSGEKGVDLQAEGLFLEDELPIVGFGGSHAQGQVLNISLLLLQLSFDILLLRGLGLQAKHSLRLF